MSWWCRVSQCGVAGFCSGRCFCSRSPRPSLPGDTLAFVQLESVASHASSGSRCGASSRSRVLLRSVPIPGEGAQEDRSRPGPQVPGQEGVVRQQYAAASSASQLNPSRQTRCGPFERTSSGTYTDW
uniref:Uncharacterized protein n=1 Tax=Cacopsylla melanoneura TaxID=428564 RepID=A0A8D9AHZ8_9HEMI